MTSTPPQSGITEQPHDPTAVDLARIDLHAEASIEETPAEREDAPTVYEGEPLPPVAFTGLEDFRPGQIVTSDDGRSPYAIKKVMSGGMGVVYVADDLNAGLPVALKTIKPEMLLEGHDDLRERFRNEALIWIGLDKHPNIVQALTIQSITGRPSIVLEYVGGAEGLGSDLRGWIKHRQLDLQLSLRIALQIGWGMAYATERNAALVHRDLKPANILISADGLAKVTDFGLAYSLFGDELRSDAPAPEDIRLTRSGAVMGTMHYMAPEQTRAAPTDARADIYATGVILYEMLTGSVPFTAMEWEAIATAHQTQPPQFPPRTERDIPASVRAFTLRCLAKHPDDRPQGWPAFVAELADVYYALTDEFPTATDGAALVLHELLAKAYGYAELGHFEDALAVYADARRLAPHSDHVWARTGRTLRLAGRFEESRVALENALAINDGYAWAWRQLGVTLDKTGRADEAVQALRKAVELRPADSWSALNLARLYQRAGQIDAAMRLLAETVERDPANAQCRALLGDLLADLGQTHDALAQFDAALDLAPNNAALLKRKGRALRRMDRLEEAAGALRDAARLDRSAWTWVSVAEILRSLRRPAEALGAAQQALRIDNNNARAWGVQADSLLHLGRYEESLEAATQAIRHEPGYAWAHRLRGVLLDRLGRRQDAIAAFESAVRLDPADPWAWQALGGVYAVLRRKDDALAALERAEAAAPERANFWVTQGMHYLTLRAFEQASACAVRALALAPESASAWWLKADVMRRRGRYKQAAQSYEQAVRRDPKDARSWSGLGAVLAKTHDYQDALDAYERASAIRPASPWYRLRRVDVLLKIGYIEEALESAEAASHAFADLPDAWLTLGDVQRRADRHTDAITSYNRALLLAPDLKRAWAGLSRAHRALGDGASAAQAAQKAL